MHEFERAVTFSYAPLTAEDQIKAFGAMVLDKATAAERERAAHVCDEMYPHGGYHPTLRRAAAQCAAAIRKGQP